MRRTLPEEDALAADVNPRDAAARWRTLSLVVPSPTPRLSISSLLLLALVGCSDAAGDASGAAGGQGGQGGSALVGGASNDGGSADAGGAADGGEGTGGQLPSGFASIVDEATFDAMFLHDDDGACPSAGMFDYAAVVAASERYPSFCAEGSLDDRKREAAAFLANISHETTGGWPAAPDGPYAWGLCFNQEVGCEGGACTGYCDAANAMYPCAEGKTYHGRGPMQLSWNYNYGQAGDALALPLLATPELVVEDAETGFLTALWFWQTPQAPKPSCHDVMAGKWTPSAADRQAGRTPGFGLTIDIINGGIECGQPTPPQVEDRIGFYLRYCEMLGVDPGPALDCASMAPF